MDTSIKYLILVLGYFSTGIYSINDDEILMNKFRRHLIKTLPLAFIPADLIINKAYSATTQDVMAAKKQPVDKISDVPSSIAENDIASLKLTSPYNSSFSRTLRSKLSDSVSIKDFGGSTDGDNHDAFIKAIKEKVGCLYIPPGTWPYSGLLNTGTMRIVGTGPYPEQGSRMLAIDNSAIFKIGSGAYISGLYFDGNGKGSTDGKGEYGVILPSSQAILMENVHIRYFRKYGVVLDRVQNSTLVKVNSQYNGVNYLFNNGARNMVLLGCNAALDINKNTGRIRENRNILMTQIKNDPLLTADSIGQSNSRIQIIGGIYEYADYADCNIEINAAGSRGFNDILMQGVEITEAREDGYLIALKQGSMKIENCEFNGKDSAKSILVGAKGSLTIPADGSFGSGGRGKLAPHYGIDIENGGTLIAGRPGSGIPTATNNPGKGKADGWARLGNNGTVLEWLNDLRAVQVTYQNGGTGAQRDYAIRSSITPLGTLIHIKGHIDIISGESISLAIVLKDGRTRTIMTKLSSLFETYYRMQGDESNKVALIANEKIQNPGKFNINVLETSIF